MVNNPYSQYKNNSILTASPAQLTLMLYNGAIKFSNIAIEAIENNEIENAHKNIVKVEDIITELQVTLKPEYEVSKSIGDLYVYIKDLLIQANISKDIDKLIEARDFITEFRDLWKQVMQAK